MISLKFNKVHDDAKLPTRKHETDAGWDLYSVDRVVIEPHGQEIVHTGIELADVSDDDRFANIVLQVWSRSGLDAKHGIHVGAGIIDEGYRGELLVLLKNMGNNPFLVKKGDKIAQFVPLVVVPVTVEMAESVSESDRGRAGGIAEV